MGQSALSCFESASPRECISKRSLSQNNFLCIETGNHDADLNTIIKEANRYSDISTSDYNFEKKVMVMEDTSNLTSNMTSSVIEELSIDIDPDDFIGNLIKDDEVVVKLCLPGESPGVHANGDMELTIDTFRINSESEFVVRQACTNTFTAGTGLNLWTVSDTASDDGSIASGVMRAFSELGTVSESFARSILQLSIKNPTILVGWEVYVEKLGIGQIIACHKMKFFSTKYEIEVLDLL